MSKKERLACQLLKHIIKLQKLKPRTEPNVGKEINRSECGTKIGPWTYENLVHDKEAFQIC